MKYYYFKYKDNVTGGTVKGFHSQSSVDKVMLEFMPDGHYLRHTVKALVGDFTLEYCQEQRKKHRTPIVS